MRPARRTRTGRIAAASLAAHAAVLAVVAIQAPRLRQPYEPPGTPEAVIPVLIMPRTPPPASAPGSRPQPIRLHQRSPQTVPKDDDKPSVAPLVAPTVESKAPAPSAPGPRAVTAPAAADVVAASVRQTLRGRLGCANATLLNLSREERQKCEDALASGAKQADFLGTGVDADKASGFVAAGRRKEADYRYMRGPGANGAVTSGPSAQATEPGGIRGAGASAERMGGLVGSDKPTLKVPF